MTGRDNSTRSEKWKRDRQELHRAYSVWLQENSASIAKRTAMREDPADVEGFDQPVALRRSKRRSDAISPAKPTATGSAVHSIQTSLPVTPSKARGKKRVRFSDPADYAVVSASVTSGLTPYMGRTSLSTPRRRASTSDTGRIDCCEIQFTPLRQQLDDRAKRRIRRNGLSQEMNDYRSESKQKAQLERDLEAKDLELQRLKNELEMAKSASSDHTNENAVEELSSSQRILEAELQSLRHSFNQSFDEATRTVDSDGGMDTSWDVVNIHKAGMDPGPGSDGGDTIPIYEDDGDMIGSFTPPVNPNQATKSQTRDTSADAELLVMALELEAEKQEKRQLFQEVQGHIQVSQPFASKSKQPASSLHFEDAPTPSQSVHPQLQQNKSLTASFMSLPSPPKTFYGDISKALKSTTHRAEKAELALHELEADLRDLGFGSSHDSSSSTILENVRAHFRQARLDLERAIPGEAVSGLNEPVKVLPEAISMLQLLSRRIQEREAELRSMHEQHRSLKGNFECGLRASEKASQRIKELEDAVEEGADDMLALRMKLQATEKDVVEKDHTVASLITALEKYRADVVRLEDLVVQLENEQAFKVQEGRDESGQKIGELEAKVAAEETGRRKAEESAIDRLEQISTLRAALDTAHGDASSLQVQLSALEAQKAESESSINDRHETQLQNLNVRISALSTALATSQQECTRLDHFVDKLRSRLAISRQAGAIAVETSWQELVRAVTKSGEARKSYFRGCKVMDANWAIEDEDAEEEVARRARGASGEEVDSACPPTPASMVRFADVDGADPNDDGEVEGHVQIERGRGRGNWKGSGSGKGKLSRTARSRQPARTRGLAIQMGGSKRRRRTLDSGIGMESLGEEEEDDDDDEDQDEDLGFDLPQYHHHHHHHHNPSLNPENSSSPPSSSSSSYDRANDPHTTPTTMTTCSDSDFEIHEDGSTTPSKLAGSAVLLPLPSPLPSSDMGDTRE